MPSEFDTFAAEFAAPMLVEHFGDRAALRIIPQGGGDGVAVDAIIGRVRIEAEDDADNLSLLMETRTVQAKQTDLGDNLRIKAEIYVEGDKAPWSISTITDGDAPIVAFEVERRHVTDRSRSRRGAA